MGLPDRVRIVAGSGPMRVADLPWKSEGDLRLLNMTNIPGLGLFFVQYKVRFCARRYGPHRDERVSHATMRA